MPEVDSQLKKIKESFLEVSKSLASATLPTLKEFSEFLIKVSNGVKSLSKDHVILLNNILKFGAALIVFTTLAIVIGNLIKTIGALTSAFKGLLLLVTNPEALLIMGVIITALIALFVLFRKQIDEFVGSFLKGFNSVDSQLQKSQDLFGRFVRGFRSNFETFATDFENLGASIGSNFAHGLDDTLFNVVLGRFNNLKDVAKSLGEDLLHSLTKFASNQILGFIFGNKSTGESLLDKTLKKTTNNFERLNDELKRTIDNFRFLQRSKDEAAFGLQKFGADLNVAGEQQKLGTGILAQGMVTASNVMLQAAGNFGNGIIQILNAISKGGKGGGNILGGLLSIGGSILGNILLPGIGSALGGLFGGGATAATSLGFAAAAPAASALGPELLPTLAFSPLPLLANGGLVQKPTALIAGDDGPEAIIPLDKMDQMGGGGVIVNFNGHTFLNNKAQVDYLVNRINDAFVRKTNRRTGGTSLAF